jgi:hypothetical protein
MMSIRSTALIGLTLAGCQYPQTGGIDQKSVCVYSDDTEAQQCDEGQLAWFDPPVWGNEQLPLIAIASYCNTNYPIAMNNAGVVCVFTQQRAPTDP